jgi:hypothetical protein
MKQQFTASDALTIARVMCALERQINKAWDEQRDEDACAIARLIGTLRARLFYTAGEPYETPLDELWLTEAA